MLNIFPHNMKKRGGERMFITSLLMIAKSASNPMSVPGEYIKYDESIWWNYYSTLERNKVLWLRSHKSESPKKIKFTLHMSKIYMNYILTTLKNLSA